MKFLYIALCLLYTCTSQDCETFTSFETCKGKTHEGQPCYWSAADLQCEDGEAEGE